MDTRTPHREQEALIEGQQAGALDLPASLNPHQHGTPEHREWERGRSTALARKASREMASRVRVAPCRYRIGACECGGRGLCLDVA